LKTLLTGASGFVGRHLLPAMLQRHDVDALVRRTEADLPTGTRVVAGDLESLDPSALPRDVDVVVHLASRIDDPFGRDPAATELMATNVDGTLRLLEWAAETGVRRFIYGSTGGITGEGEPGQRVHEDRPPHPPNPYNLTKHLAEQAVLTYDWPFEVCSLRYWTPYAKGGTNPLIIHLIERLRAGEAIETGSDDGPWMNPIHIDDAVALTLRAIDIDEVPRVVNIAGPDVVSRVAFVDRLAETLGLSATYERGVSPAPSWAADIERLERTLGSPKIGVAEGIAREWGGSA
jgi:nucleoside-diphosphate-sugar epimerase